jgi:hypothetical protein
MAAALIAIAMTPDDAVDLDAQLNKLVQMVVDRVAAVEYPRSPLHAPAHTPPSLPPASWPRL